MSINTEITRISNAKTAIAESIANKGVTVPSGTKIDGMATLIDSIETGGSGGDTSETWVLNETLNLIDLSVDIDFVSNNLSFVKFEIFNEERITRAGGIAVKGLRYHTSQNTSVLVDPALTSWKTNAYRKVTFATAPTGDLLTWLQSNAVKQASDTAVQPSKSRTVTSNGTITIAADAPYDSIKQVALTVKVKSTATVMITNQNSTMYECYYMLPTGGWTSSPKYLKRNTPISFAVMQYSPIFINSGTKAFTNTSNFVKTSRTIVLGTGGKSYNICYATSENSSATISTT